MNFYDTKFYDNASAGYSDNRYSKLTKSYIQFFFKKRLSIVLSLINKYYKNKNDLRLLELGCADGIVIHSILNNYPNIFSECVGSDISPEMISVANSKNKNNKVKFYVKGNGENGKFDIVLAIGFLTPSIFDNEFNYIKGFLKQGGLFMISLASRESIYTRLKLKDKDYAKDYWNHKQYRQYLNKNFELIETCPYGLFIPKLWSIPFLAKYLQPIIENIAKYIIPDLFHEKIYVLKMRSN